MRKERFVAINTQLWLCIVIFPVFAWLSVSCAVGTEIGGAVLFGIFSLLPVFVFFISPLYCVFDSNGVLIVYHFGQKEMIPWDSIRDITLMGSWIGGGGPPHYVLAYPRREKRPFFVCGEIPKTRRTKKLIRKYCKKDIIADWGI